MDETGQVAVVTGGASGIGRACVDEIAAAGSSVIAVDLNADLLATHDHERVTMVAGDIADEDTWVRVKAAADDRFGRAPTQLVAAAGYLDTGTILDTSEEAWARILEVNIMGTVRGARALLPGMIEQGKGSIVTIGSIDSYMAEQGLIAYCASKGAVLQLTRVLALDHARDGIRANCLAPGVTDTPLFRHHADLVPWPDTYVAEREARQPIGRLMDPSDIAKAAAFLVSDAASGITGALVPVDGGLTTGFDFRA